MASNNNLTDVFNDIATAINNKGVSGTMTPVEMADKIAEIPTGSTPFEYGIPIKTGNVHLFPATPIYLTMEVN